MQEFIKSGFKVKLVETDEELYAVRKLRYEELVLFHRDASEISFEQSFTEEDRYCDNLIVVDTANGAVVGSYRFITKETLKHIDGFYSEWGFNVDDIKNQPYNVMELGKAAVHKDYRNSIVVRLMFQGAVRFAKEHNIRMMFGIITLPEMENDDLLNLMSYLYHNYPSKDPTLQPYALEPSIPMDSLPYEQVDELKAKRQVPPILKAYLSMGCMFAKSACPRNKMLHHADMLIMLDLENVNQHYVSFILR